MNTSSSSSYRHVPPPSLSAAEQPHCIVDPDQYERLRAAALADPDAYWAGRGRELLDWRAPFHTVQSGDLDSGIVRWFDGGRLNACENCLDRHVQAGHGERLALIWQGEGEEERRTFTYQELLTEVCRCAALLTSKGVRRGDRLVMYLPMIPELAVAMLACARIGAVHSVVFAGFSAVSLRNRIQDCRAVLLVTADGTYRQGRALELKTHADEALIECDTVTSCLVVRRTGIPVYMHSGRDSWWDEPLDAGAEVNVKPPAMESEDPLFILYTSGSTGRPKGIVHATGGYLTYALHTTQLVFDLRPEDVHWCTADYGWITGHTYGLYGPLGRGSTSLMFEGAPYYPGPDRLWRIVAEHRVSIFYTAPTTIRTLMRFGEAPPAGHDLSSLRIIGSVGEPINPEAWKWFYEHVGGGRCPLVDTWWQTETGGIMIAPLPYGSHLKPGSAALPLPGIDAAILDENDSQTAVDQPGHLVIRRPWPGMLRGLYNDAERFHATYFSAFSGCYDAADGARRDEDGYFWIIGRLDDVINVFGHRLGSAEIESALVSHPDVAEVAVVGRVHPVKGQAVYGYVTVKEGVEQSDELLAELRRHVRTEIGPIAVPDTLQFAPKLPKTRSGKIVRRILRKIAGGDYGDFGDTSTLADPEVVRELIAGRREQE
ncbi:MAG: acetate--CoA ligase [Desulfofustis sp. PB-SRB1]|jgi:acetyl-CoA synthetase|nr:acetate--CoA ligase [Desulfofustis sp. PB-SRB1]MBM1002842.1 acetate--CoA ligase [Desulfofustis sp. PB-SRB1]HBH28945.1 acetate--CoA ligase [Desulfofustis sp.]HBH30801.1 acetate--CoA ligase [Desulfofustis sp.]